ncbi:MAG: aldehyde dehydrogenase family protein [Ilumatobacteraceae bacterium]
MTTVDAIPDIVQNLRDGFRAGVVRTIESRTLQLQCLRALVDEQQERLIDALAADVGKPRIEAYTTEIAFTINEIDHTLKHLESWMKPEKVKVPLTFKPGKASLVPEPVGTVCIISPWNYPVQLLLAPLVAALAAGNTAVLKPSEVTPTVAALIEELVPQYLDPRAVSVVTGAVDETTALLEQRFDHIFYTGNGAVGRIVMRAAAEHLTPVTLELGGKSPAIVATDANISIAARRIAWGKFLNAGQTCVAPDYVLVEEGVEDELLEALSAAVTEFYGDDPRESADYARIVNVRHHDRLTGLLDAGGFETTVVGGTGDRDARYLAPTVVAGVQPDSKLMNEEIFGPILPVIVVEDIDEAIRFVNDRDKPLALYAFSESNSVLEHVVANTSAGGVTLNHAVLHLAVPDMPFGGVGPSGMGAYHGKSGFDTFSHHKAVLAKPSRPDPSLMYPPYTGLKQKLLRKFM